MAASSPQAKQSSARATELTDSRLRRDCTRMRRPLTFALPLACRRSPSRHVTSGESVICTRNIAARRAIRDLASDPTKDRYAAEIASAVHQAESFDLARFTKLNQSTMAQWLDFSSRAAESRQEPLSLRATLSLPPIFVAFTLRAACRGCKHLHAGL